ncbi:MAG: hypothetical protein HYR60_04455 [Acidobacteria bacterium]|nr:hypothetical protein [Acidobacteriota bacterium]
MPNAKAELFPERVPKFRIPDDISHKKAAVPVVVLAVPTTCPRSLIPEAQVKVRPSRGYGAAKLAKYSAV